MRREHDERAKLIAEQTLDELGDVAREVEIPTSDAQRIDLWLRRSRFPQGVPGYLRLLDALFPEDAMLEAFSAAIRLVSFYDVLRKQYDWRRHLAQRLGEQAPPGAEVPLLRPPWLWLLSAGRPEALFTEYDLRPRVGFPVGIYDFGKGFRIGLLVINELPAGVETLLLRLMGSSAVQRAALAELARLPSDDPEVQALLRIVANLQHTFKNAKNIDEEDRDDFMTAAKAEFEKYEQLVEQRGEQRGELRGEQRGEQRSVKKLCGAFQIPLTEERVRQLELLDAEGLGQLFDQLLATRTWPAP